MALELLATGQRVSLASFGGGTSREVYKVVRALPAEGRPLQYRIKSDAESFERVVEASRLKPWALA